MIYNSWLFKKNICLIIHSPVGFFFVFYLFGLLAGTLPSFSLGSQSYQIKTINNCLVREISILFSGVVLPSNLCSDDILKRDGVLYIPNQH